MAGLSFCARQPIPLVTLPMDGGRSSNEQAISWPATEQQALSLRCVSQRGMC